MPVSSNLVRGMLVSAGLLIATLIAGVAPATSGAAGVPDISLQKSSPGRILFGETAEVTLTASNPTGQPVGYNLSFRDVLPAGVSYVPGSAGPLAGEPRIVNDAPAAGQTTLIWSNLSDLTPSSSFELTFEVSHSDVTLAVSDTYTNNAGAYLNCDPRYVPKFNQQGAPTQSGGNPDCSGTPPETSYTGWAQASADTRITAIEILKDEPSPEGQLLRGLHDHQTVYTLTVNNNLVNPSDSLRVEDFIPAGLEFLGCGTTDNTTDAPSNPGSAEEYPGSGPINPGNAPAAPDCVEPDVVETVANPPGYPAGVYTHVVWEDLGDMAPGDTIRIQYVAAVPIRENTIAWSGTEPATDGPQASNLDNNSGPETRHRQGLTNHAAAFADYQAPGGPTAVTDETEHTVEAMDLRIVKSVTPEQLSAGAISRWNLNIATSEYRYQENVEVTDTLGNGYCPLGPVNYTNGNQPSDAECDPTGDDPSAPYTAADEQADGTWEITWDQSTYPALALIQPNADFDLSFPTRTRQHYQENFQDADPVAARDTGHNDVGITGESWVICAPGAPSPCPAGDPDKIFNQWTDGTVIDDESAASQAGDGPTIDKQVSPTVNGSCGTLTDYDSGVVPVARPGDTVCWRLTMDFPDNLISTNVRVTDFLPGGTTYVPGSTVTLPSNNVTIGGTAPPEPDPIGTSGLLWTLDDGGDSVGEGKTFDLVFATRVVRTIDTSDGDVEGNLMKAVYTNSAGTSFPLRDAEDMQIAIPEIGLLKGVYQVNGQPTPGNGPNVDGVGVTGGDVVTYRVDVTNDGSIDAVDTQIWDILPPEVSCADVDPASISNGGSCNAAQDRIEWSGITVPADDAVMLTYDVEIPDGLTGGDVLVNTAGVRQFESPSGSGPYVQIPAENIDPTQDPNANAPAAKDPSNVFIENAVLVKSRSTQIDQPGNNAADQATIGELISYTVTATIPEGTTLYGDDTALVDDVSPRLTLVGAPAATLDTGTGGPVSLPTAGLALSVTGNQIRIDFPNPYTNAEHSGDDVIVLTFTARVNDAYPDNFAQGTPVQHTVPNTATLSWETATGTERDASDSVDTTVVEPQIEVGKSTPATSPVAPGDFIDYTIEVSNGTGSRVSTANDTTVVDTVPAGLTPVNGSTPVPDGGVVNPDNGIWDEGARTISWPSIATLAPGASTTRAYRALVDDDGTGAGSLTNTVVARTTSMPGTVTGERDSSTCVPEAPQSCPGYLDRDQVTLELPSAGIVKSGDPGRATIGQHVTNTLRVTIPPDIHQWDVTVEDDLPDGLLFDGYVSAECVSGCAAGPTMISPVPLNPVANGDGTRIGWWFGDLAAAASPRVVDLVYGTHIGAEYQGGGDVTDGDVLTNEATLLFNLTDKVTTPPTDPPDPSDFDEERETDNPTEVVEPSLTLDKAVSGDDDDDDQRFTKPGDGYTYSIQVTNTGNAPAYDVVVADEPDVELTNVAVATGSDWEVTKDWSADDRTIRWLIPGPIDPGDSVTLTYTADLIPSAGLVNDQQVVNTADVPEYWGVPETEREDPDNSDVEYRRYDDVDPDTVTLIVLVPTLTLDKTTGLAGNPDTGDAETEDPFPWRIVITNPNPGSELYGVDLTDTLPPNWTYVPGSAQITGSGDLTPGGQVEPTITTAATGDVLTWDDIADLTGVANVIVEFSAVPQPQAAVDPGLDDPHVNDAEAIGEDSSGATGSGEGPYEDSDDATADLQAPVTDLQIVKTADDPTPVAGTDTTWTLTVRNNGGKIAPSVRVTDVLPAGLTYVSAVPEQGTCEESPAGTVSCEIGQMEVGEEVEIELTTRVGADTAGQTLVNPADVTDPNIEDSDPSNDHSEDEVTPAGSAGVAIAKTVGRPLFAGQVGTYDLTVTNHGPSVAEDVTVTDTLPDGLTYAGSDTPVGSCTGAGQDFSCDLGDLDPGQTVTIELSVNVAKGVEYANCAEVASSTADPEQSDNRSCVTSPAANTDLAIEKSGPDFFPAGKSRDYTLLVTNVGDQPSGGTVTVTDQVPGQLEPEAAFGDGWDCGVAGQLVTCTRSDALAPGASFPAITIRVKPHGNPLFQAISNTAEVNLPGDPNPDNDRDTVTVERGAICADGSLTLKPSFTWVGERRTVTLTLRSENGAVAAGLPVRVRGNGKGGANRRTRTLTTNSKGQARFEVHAKSRAARWIASVPQCGLRTVLQPRVQPSCRNMNVTPRSMRAGTVRTVTVRLRSRSGRPLVGVAVKVKGKGVRKSARTNARGIARLKVRPKQKGMLRVTAPKATGCVVEIGVRSAQLETGAHLTG